MNKGISIAAMTLCLAPLMMLGCMRIPQETKPPALSAQPAPENPAGLFPSVKINHKSENRHRLDEYAYQEQKWEGATHVLGTIHNEITWARAKNPYIMDENVYVARDGTLKIEPGVVVKVTRAADPTNFNDAYIGLIVMGTLAAEGTPDAMIRFTPAAANPQPAREWREIAFDPGCPPGILKWAIVEGAISGVDANGCALIAHSVFRKCHTGIRLKPGFSGDVAHNISAQNRYPGICFQTTPSEASAVNNILYENRFGVDASFWNATPYADYNLYFTSPANAERLNSQFLNLLCVDYYGMDPGPHDVYADPLFVNLQQDDFRLQKKSPARRAGSDRGNMGLDIENWSQKSAKRENDLWLADGGRQLWTEGLAIETQNPRQAQSKFESALKKPLDPVLKDKVSCALGRALTAQGKPQEAEKILRKVIKKSHNPHVRDMARRHLAEALVSLNRNDDASALLDGIEWPRSKVWAEPAKARCNLQDPRRALASLEAFREKEPHSYLKVLSEMVEEALKKNQLQTVSAFCDRFDAYPESPIGSQVRLRAAQVLYGQGQMEDAAKLLKKIVDTDPFGREAPQALSLLAKIEGKSSGRADEARQILTRLCTDYYLFDPLVREARRETGFKPLSPRNMILLDASQGEFSIYDRDIQGSYNFGQYEVIQTLSRGGSKVHTNESGRRLVLDEMKHYGLVIMNGIGGGSGEPPMNPDAIEACDAYVKNGGNLLVIASGEHLGSGKTHLFYNPLLQRFGMKFKEGAGIPWEHNACVVTRHPALQGLDGFTAYGGVTIDPGKGEVLGTYNGEPIIAAMPYGKGRVVAAGLGVGLLGTFMNPHRHNNQQENIRKNEALLIRLATYLLADAPSQVSESILSPAGPLPSREERKLEQTRMDQGFKITLTLPKRTFKLGEPIILTYTITNVSGKPQTLSFVKFDEGPDWCLHMRNGNPGDESNESIRSRFVRDGLYWDFEIEGFRNSRPFSPAAIEPFCLDRNAEAPKLEIGDFVTLSPGKSHRCTLNLPAYYYRKKSFTEPGDYKVRICHGGFGGDDPGQKTAKELGLSSVFKNELISDYIVFTISGK